MSLNLGSVSSEIQELYRVARKTKENSYSPYSRCQVGAAIQLSNQSIYSGCNVENSSFGATVCAERVAVQKAVSEEGPIQISVIMVVTDATPPWPPCGMCRQVIAEFATLNTVLYTANLAGELLKFAFAEIFPHAFERSYLGTV